MKKQAVLKNLFVQSNMLLLQIHWTACFDKFFLFFALFFVSIFLLLFSNIVIGPPQENFKLLIKWKFEAKYQFIKVKFDLEFQKKITSFIKIDWHQRNTTIKKILKSWKHKNIENYWILMHFFCNNESIAKTIDFKKQTNIFHDLVNLCSVYFTSIFFALFVFAMIQKKFRMFCRFSKNSYIIFKNMKWLKKFYFSFMLYAHYLFCFFNWQS